MPRNFLECVYYDSESGYKIGQEPTIPELLFKHGLGKENLVRAPMGGDLLDDDKYGGGALLPADGPGSPERPTIKTLQSLLGSLLWIARCMRPYIAFAVHHAYRRAHAPTIGDLKLAICILRYLAGSADLKLAMNCDGGPNIPLRIEIFTDADFAGDKKDRKSVSGGIVRISGTIVGWHCKKQTAVALSTAESEYVAASIGAKEILVLK
ncbi:unnamed protein product [Peronospora farinosa]|uniref:Reverse transcriptase Ty1/copia-type domain-containing protein n=1 Tax=Peronospora farinosa TaxID=134698 RepID=A0AAV0TFL9_9STRA|nr:unnamed protein product [Peronospora farinosa]CAI5719654.1 unnamed protein product [Peronospora farinosa]